MGSISWGDRAKVTLIQTQKARYAEPLRRCHDRGIREADVHIAIAGQQFPTANDIHGEKRNQVELAAFDGEKIGAASAPSLEWSK